MWKQVKILEYQSKMSLYLFQICRFRINRFSIAYAEMFSQAKALAASQKSMIPFVAAAIFYYVFNYVVAFIMEFFEKKMSYYH